jgi:glycosyltransferase EpsF
MNRNNIAPKRILHLPGSLQYGGVPMMLFNFYKHIDRSRFQFDFLHYSGYAPYHDEIEAMGGHIYRIPSIGEAGLFRYVRELRRVMLENGPFHAIHIHTNYMAGFIALVARTCGIKKRICHMRGTFIRNRKIKLMLPFLRLLIRWNATKLLAVSEASGKYFYRRKPFTVIKNGVDTNLFFSISMDEIGALKRELGITPHSIAIGHVARFTQEKNHRFLVEVAKRLEASGREYRFFFAGDGPLQEPTKALFEGAGLGGRAVFLGNRGDVPALMHAFDLTLLPSLSEGLPNVVMQSQAAGTPCVLSDCLTREVDIGLRLLAYCPLGNAQQWAESILWAAQLKKPDKDTIFEAFVKSGFDIRVAVMTLQRIYEDE